MKLQIVDKVTTATISAAVVIMANWCGDALGRDFCESNLQQVYC